ncbi:MULTISPECIES: serine hydrolase [unclassified Thioalkalivibrio]|uniref:serine hydrolase domain-containing protein n=1 Tax=unclassified Thioalkalivibrio TaxID=2621013 RepID=UPI00036C0E97|nr:MULTISPECIES: serine hydrolase [unclassified Thioalkalivibrio]
MIRTTNAALIPTLLVIGAALAPPTSAAGVETVAPMDWMQGFPPPEDRTIRFTDDDYFVGDKLKWTVCHFRELMPTVGVRSGPEGARALPYASDPAIDDLTFQPSDGSELMTWSEAFDVNHADGLLVLHQGRVVYERYAGCLDEHTLHGVMSVTKSLTGLIGETLVAEGTLDEQARVGELVPELADSAFGDATLRQVLDMTTALDFSEDYSDPEADVWAYAQAGSPLPPPADYDGPRGYFAFLETVEKAGEHGEAFGYRTINSDALGWIISRATGKSVADWLAERVWSRIGAEREAFFTVDSIGTPFAGGGFNATLRDLGRLGQLILDGGRLGDEQVLPEEAIKRIREGGDKAAFSKAGFGGLDGWSYRSMWWISHDDHGVFAARGVHGQTIWIDPSAEMVIVRLASHPLATNAANDATSLPAYRVLAEYLMGQDTAR